MPTYFCSGAGSDANSGLTWALAKGTFAGAIAAATAAGDVIAVDAANPPPALTANTTWTFLNNVTVVASTNSGISTITPTTMGTAGYLGSSTAGSITVSGAFRVAFYGVTLRVGGTASANLTINTGDGAHFEFEDCRLWLATTGSSADIAFGGTGSALNSFTHLRNCIISFQVVGQGIAPGGHVIFEGCTIDPAGAAPTNLVQAIGQQYATVFESCDLSRATGNLVQGAMGSATPEIRFVRCKLAAGAIPMAVQSVTNKSGAKVFVIDCHDSNAHGRFGYYDSFGACESNTGVRVTAGPADQSWQVVTTGNCSFDTPFRTPWIDQWLPTTATVTPRIEVLRTDSVAARNDAEVWAEFSTKESATSTQATMRNDRQGLAARFAGTAGTSHPTGLGTGAWTGAGATPWSGKLELASSVTPGVAGYCRGRVVVAAPNTTLYVDPVVRT